MLSSLFSRKDDDSGLFATYGYAYTHIMFYALYMLSYSVELSCKLVLGIPVLLAIGGASIHMLKSGRMLSMHPRAYLKSINLKTLRIPCAAIIAVVVVLLAAWPHLHAGWGHYWHSGNYDLDDGLLGREAYLNYNIFDQKPFDLSIVTGDKSWGVMKELTHTASPREHLPQLYQEWYAGGFFRFQYSSLAFWSGLYNEPYGMDIVLLQMLFGLILMATGIFSLCRTIFHMSQRAALATALCATCNAFFINTYFSGHIGSLMYGAFAPALLQLCLKINTISLLNTRQIFFFLLLTVATVYSYLHPLIILAVPVVLYHSLTRERTTRMFAFLRTTVSAPKRLHLFSLLFFILALITVVGLVLWYVTDDYRIRADTTYRAWGYTMHPLSLPLMLGILPAPVVGARFLGNMLTHYNYIALIALSCIFAAILLLFYIRYAKEHSRFLLIFSICWVGWYLFFLLMVRDSYYLYKFLYTQQFLLIIGIAGYFTLPHPRWANFFALAIIISNLSCVIYSGQEIASRPYNAQPDRYNALLNVQPTLLRDSFLELTSGDRIAVRQLTLKHGFPTLSDPRDAKYFILPKVGISDITSSQLENMNVSAQPFKLNRAPENNFLFVRTWFDPEVFEKDKLFHMTSYRWVGHGKNGTVGIFVARPSAPGVMAGRYLRICYQKGPSAIGPIEFSIFTADRQLLQTEILYGDQPSCAWIPAETVLNSQLPLLVSSQTRGKSILPYDDRILLYRVFEINWSDHLFDSQIARFFNLENDIVANNMSTHSIQLRLGWEALEVANGESFRWVGNKAEIVIMEAMKSRATCRLDVEPGPSLGTTPFRLEVENQVGAIIHTSSILKGRTTISFPLEVTLGTDSIYRLKTKSDNLTLLGDERRLNFRVFRIWTQGE